MLGHFDNLQEGVRNVGRSISKQLVAKGHDVEEVDITSIGSLSSLAKFKPDVIHAILTPTVFGLAMAKVLSNVRPSSKLVISAIHSTISAGPLIRLLKPDLILVQSQESEQQYKKMGWHVEFLPNGVDFNAFHPATSSEKSVLRAELLPDSSKYVITHVASLTKGRNVSALIPLAQEDNILWIVGRRDKNLDIAVIDDLKKAGAYVTLKNYKNMSDVYNSSDAYAFPTLDPYACIEAPLSVLEAMACNVPVITTPFGALPRMFEEKDGLYFYKDQDEMEEKVELAKSTSRCNTRELVEQYSWQNITNQLITYYEEVSPR